QKRLEDRRRLMPVIFIAGHGDIRMAVTAIKAGAIEFLTKPLEHQPLLDAVHEGIERSRSARQDEAAFLILRDRYASLTPRERQVMGLVVSGLLNKQVAGELGTSEITVKAHRGQVMRKMNADSFASLVRMGARLQLPLAGRH
ncbi:MAG: LuxR C-terminal-related transcriptional regulator, partial [Acidobacteriota bacterium]